MAWRFAHLADAHLGAFRDPVLRDLNLRAFLRCLEVAREEGAELLVMAGDLFDTNLPDMAVVERAAAGIRALKEAGIRIYAFYGSHDRTQTETGIVDVLASTGLFANVGVQELEDGSDVARPPVVLDPGTGAALTAIGGRRRGLERSLLGSLDREWLAGEVAGAPFAIFGYHGAVEGMMPPELSMVESVPTSQLPPGFQYYALGHIHHHASRRVEGGGLAAYPGPTFGADFRDLSDGRPKGLLIVDVDEEGTCEARHVQVEVAPVDLLDVDVGGLAAEEGRELLQRRAAALEPLGRVVLLRARGELVSGRPAGLEVPRVRDDLLSRGAQAVHVNRAGLTGRDRGRGGEGTVGGGPGGADPQVVARSVLGRYVEEHASPVEWLRGEGGLELALELLEVLRRDRGAATTTDHRNTVLAEALSVLGGDGRLAGGPAPAASAETEPDGATGTLDDWKEGGGE